MKKIITISLLLISFRLSGEKTISLQLQKELQLIEDTLNWVQDEKIKRDMRARKMKILNNLFSS